jgi:hypothetical protein
MGAAAPLRLCLSRMVGGEAALAIKIEIEELPVKLVATNQCPNAVGVLDRYTRFN